MSNEEFKPKQGDKVEVRDWVDDEWVVRVFAITHEGGRYCDSSSGNALIHWSYIRPIPTKPKSIPFTHETWPKQLVWVRSEHWEHLEQGAMLVTAVMEDGVALGAKDQIISFADIATGDTSMSLDFCRTWQPCHYVPGGEE